MAELVVNRRGEHETQGQNGGGGGGGGGISSCRVHEMHAERRLAVEF